MIGEIVQCFLYGHDWSPWMPWGDLPKSDPLRTRICEVCDLTEDNE